MLRLVLALVLVLIVVLAATFASIRFPPIAVEIGGWRLHMGAVAFSVGLLGLAALLALFFRLLLFVFGIPAYLAQMRGRFRQKQSMQKLGEGLTAYAEGRYQRAAALFKQADTLPAPLRAAVDLLVERCNMRDGDIEKRE